MLTPWCVNSTMVWSLDVPDDNLEVRMTTASRDADEFTLAWQPALSVWDVADAFDIDLEWIRMAEHRRQIQQVMANPSGLATLFLRLGIKNAILNIDGCYKPIDVSQLDAIVELLVGGPAPKLDVLPLLVPTRELLERTLFTRVPMRVEPHELMAPAVEIAKHRITFLEASLHYGVIQLRLKFEQLKGRRVVDSWEDTWTIPDVQDLVQEQGAKR